MFATTEDPMLPTRPDVADLPPNESGCKPWPNVAKCDQPLTAKHTPATRAEYVVFPEDFHRGTTACEWSYIPSSGGKRLKIDAKHRVLGHFGHLLVAAPLDKTIGRHSGSTLPPCRNS